MNNKTIDESLAFPQLEVLSFERNGHGDLIEPFTSAKGGMLLRDYFAAHFLSGMLAHSKRYRPRTDAPSNWHDAIAEEAFQLADAALKARGK